MTIDVTQIVTLTGGLLTLIAFAKIIIKPVKTLQGEFDLMRDGLKLILYFRLERECNRLIDRGWAAIEEQEMVTELYTSYHDLGGNGWGTALYNRVLALPTKPHLTKDEIHDVRKDEEV